MRLERGLSGERSAATIIAESGSPGGELCDAIVPLRTSESCHYCPRLQTAGKRHGRGTRTGQELQDRELSHTPSPPETIAPVSLPSADPLGSLRRHGDGRTRAGSPEVATPGAGSPCPRSTSAAPPRAQSAAPRAAAARGPGAGLPPAAGRWEPVIGEAAD